MSKSYTFFSPITIFYQKIKEYFLNKYVVQRIQKLNGLFLKRADVMKHLVLKKIETYPFVSFLFLLVLILVVIIIGDRIRKPESVVLPPELVKKIEVFEVSDKPTISMQAQVKKQGLITIVAQTGGVVQKVNAAEGKAIRRGQSILTLASNARGANAPAISRQISNKNYQFLVDTFEIQRSIIQKNRELATKAETQQAKLREISRVSFDETRGMITLNEEILNSLDDQLETLENNNANGVNDTTILNVKVSKAQILGALSGLRAGLRTNEYLQSDNKESAGIAVISRDSTLQQLEIQEKSLEMQKDIAGLNVQLAKISESAMYPSSSVTGRVERIHVKVGDTINPGTVLATVVADDNSATAIVHLSSQLARYATVFQPATFVVDGTEVLVMPSYISSEPTKSGLHTALFELPVELGTKVSDGAYLLVKMPIGLSTMGQNKSPFIPLDAVYQGESGAYVLVVRVQDGSNEYRAEAKKVTIGKVFGSFVELVTGVDEGSLIITSRSVIAGEKVIFETQD